MLIKASILFGFLGMESSYSAAVSTMSSNGRNDARAQFYRNGAGGLMRSTYELSHWEIWYTGIPIAEKRNEERGKS